MQFISIPVYRYDMTDAELRGFEASGMDIPDEYLVTGTGVFNITSLSKMLPEIIKGANGSLISFNDSEDIIASPLTPKAILAEIRKVKEYGI